MSEPLPRRGFLRGLVSLPLIGGGVTLIGRPAAMAALARLPAAPLTSSIKEALAEPKLIGAKARARYAWATFSSAMNELTVGTDGWIVECGGDRRPLLECSIEGGPWLLLASVHYVRGSEPRNPKLIIERHRDIDIGLN